MIRAVATALSVVCLTSLVFSAANGTIPDRVEALKIRLESFVERAIDWPASPAAKTQDTDQTVIAESAPEAADVETAPRVIIVDEQSGCCPTEGEGGRRFRRNCVR